jgi:hypothetical protein
MCKATVVLATLAMLTSPLHAQPVDCAVPCGCLEQPPTEPPKPALVAPELPPVKPFDPERAEAEREARVGVGIGIGLFAVGAAIATAHAFTARSPESVYDLVPVAGPMANVFLTNEGSWSSALLFSAWLEAAGILVAAVSAAYLGPSQNPNQIRVGVSSDGKSGSLGLSGRF